jgi:hypothetical protein
MKGIRIDFDKEEGPSFNFEEPIEDFSALIQNALVNVGTSKGSDLGYPDKGTSLLKEAVSGFLTSDIAIVNQSKFAAIDTLFFSRQNSSDNFEEFIEEVELIPIDFDINTLSIQTRFLSSSGERVGNITSILI